MNTMPGKNIKIVAIYARVSTKKQETKNQIKQLREYCKKSDWQIYDEYIDEQSGGTSERTNFKRLFEDAHKKKFDLVFFWALDRFSREGALPTLKHLERLSEYDIGFKSYTEQYIDSVGVFGEVIIALLSAVAKQERVRLSERTKAGLERAKAQGKRLGMAPLPQDKSDEIKKLRKQKLSYRAIASKVSVSIGSVSKILNK